MPVGRVLVGATLAIGGEPEEEEVSFAVNQVERDHCVPICQPLARRVLHLGHQRRLVLGLNPIVALLLGGELRGQLGLLGLPGGELSGALGGEDSALAIEVGVLSLTLTGREDRSQTLPKREPHQRWVGATDEVG